MQEDPGEDLFSSSSSLLSFSVEEISTGEDVPATDSTENTEGGEATLEEDD